MKIIIFGLTISSSWGNGHATLWRGLCRALAGNGHDIVFFERDVPYYALNRDLNVIEGGELVLYAAWAEARARASREIDEADAVVVTSFCPDGVCACDLVLQSKRPLKVYYDLDTPVTLAYLASGETAPYLGPHDLSGFDLVLSYTGGTALDELRRRLGARLVAPLYGHVDPQRHRPADFNRNYASDLSYLGTYAADRQNSLESLFITPARRRPQRKFLIGGAQYPPDFPWHPNIFFVRHLPPSEHPAFFSSSRMTLNVTRGVMAAHGWCPSGRLFEAAACGATVLSDWWEGLDRFFTPGEEILVARTSEDAIDALDIADSEIRRIAVRARERTLTMHTAERRSLEFLNLLETARSARRTSCAMEV